MASFSNPTTISPSESTLQPLSLDVPTVTTPSLNAPVTKGPKLPRKRILTPSDLTHFQSSTPFYQIKTFIDEMSQSVRGVSLKRTREEEEEGDVEPIITSLLQVLSEIKEIAIQTPAIHNPKSRFGNPAFRTFHQKLVEKSPQLHSTLIPNLPKEYVAELSAYLTESFGNAERIDYGSGMEINFVCWLLCLRQLGLLSPLSPLSSSPPSLFPSFPPTHSTETTSISQSLPSTFLSPSTSPSTILSDPSSNPKSKTLLLSHLVNLLFSSYLSLMRYLQSTYWLEPAGSHGAFGLDDYQCLPFLFGSSQLVGHKHIRPKSIHDHDVVEMYGDDYMYLGCIRFINEIKSSATLRWHSPLLDDISAVRTWEKLNSGMSKLHTAEVLGKLPVAQHFMFGSLWAWDGESDGDSDESSSSSDEEQVEGVKNGNGNGHHHHHEVHDGNGKNDDELEKEGMYRDDHGHIHVIGQGEGWGDCCGIRVPSAFGEKEARERMKQNGSDIVTSKLGNGNGNGNGNGGSFVGKIGGVKRVPFD